MDGQGSGNDDTYCCWESNCEHYTVTDFNPGTNCCDICEISATGVAVEEYEVPNTPGYSGVNDKSRLNTPKRQETETETDDLSPASKEFLACCTRFVERSSKKRKEKEMYAVQEKKIKKEEADALEKKWKEEDRKLDELEYLYFKSQQKLKKEGKI